MNESCIFCRIARHEVPATILLENDDLVAFRDLNGQAPVHVLVIPKRHVLGFLQLDGGDGLWNRLIAGAQDVARAEQLERGFRIVVNSGEEGGQTVGHLHLHLLGGRSMSWPPG